MDWPDMLMHKLVHENREIRISAKTGQQPPRLGVRVPTVSGTSGSAQTRTRSLLWTEGPLFVKQLQELADIFMH